MSGDGFYEILSLHQFHCFRQAFWGGREREGEGRGGGEGGGGGGGEGEKRVELWTSGVISLPPSTDQVICRLALQNHVDVLRQSMGGDNTSSSHMTVT